MDQLKRINKRQFRELKQKEFKRVLSKEQKEINAKIRANKIGRKSEVFDSVTEKKENEPDISEKIRNWAIMHNITTRALRELLLILITFGLVTLPKDPRTLLQTPKKNSNSRKSRWKNVVLGNRIQYPQTITVSK